ncbi:MAG TPA: hypothetical protein VGE36_11625 [Roseateles sp.]
MDKRALISVLTLRLDEASKARDWDAVASTDRELAATLRGWSRAELSPGERQGLQTLRAAHERAASLCDEELQRVSGVLRQMLTQRDRWHAYAESAHWADLPGGLA